MRVVLRLPRVTALFPTASGQGLGVSVVVHLALLGGTILAASLGDGTPTQPQIYTVSIVSDTAEPTGGGLPAAPPERREVQQPAPDPEPTPPPPDRKPEPKPRETRRTKPEPPTEPRPRPSTPDPPAADPEPATAPAEDHPLASAGGLAAGLAGGGAPGGGIPTIDSEAFPFAYYRRVLTSRLRAAWRRPLVPGGLTAPIRTTVRFEIMRGGAITSVDTVSASGYAPLDRSALGAVYDANPLPPLPEDFEGNRLAVSFYFELTPGS